MAKTTTKPSSASASRAWDSLTPPLSKWLLDAVSASFEKMTPVQASTIPLFMGNKDVVVSSVTGSGKTLAFLIPVIEKLLRRGQPLPRHHVGAIVISPTRELATQIHSVLVSLLAFHPPSASAVRPTDEQETDDIFNHDLKVVPQLVIGGASSHAQDLSLFLSSSSNLLIGTPGRLVELLSSPYVQCPESSFQMLVMDEGDRLLDSEFEEKLQKILGYLPKQRRTGLFSASVSEALDQIIRVGLRNPVRISVKVRSESGILEKRTPASLQMSYLVMRPTEKLPALVKLLDQITPVPQKVIIYLATCASVDYFQHIMSFPSFAIVPLHGKHTASVREKNFRRFSESLTPTILLTTDVAARGLDIPMVDLVIQLDPPSDPKVWLHRCGRAGRAGRIGLAVTFLSRGREEDYVSFLAVRKTPMTLLESPKIQVSETESGEMIRKMREIVLKDRALHDKAQRAFVSWVRSYSKHVATSIFKISDLDWKEVADAWALLKLPRMPELKTWGGEASLGLDIDFTTYQYKDAAREKRRLEPQESTSRPAKKETNKSWSDRKASKEERDGRREKRHKKHEHMRNSKLSAEEIHEKEELARMIAEVRNQNSLAAKEDEWEGFA